MANNAITLAIDIRKNRNEQSKSFGYCYPVVQTMTPVTDWLAQQGG